MIQIPGSKKLGMKFITKSWNNSGNLQRGLRSEWLRHKRSDCCIGYYIIKFERVYIFNIFFFFLVELEILWNLNLLGV